MAAPNPPTTTRVTPKQVKDFLDNLPAIIIRDVPRQPTQLEQLGEGERLKGFAEKFKKEPIQKRLGQTVKGGLSKIFQAADPDRRKAEREYRSVITDPSNRSIFQFMRQAHRVKLEQDTDIDYLMYLMKAWHNDSLKTRDPYLIDLAKRALSPDNAETPLSIEEHGEEEPGQEEQRKEPSEKEKEEASKSEGAKRLVPIGAETEEKPEEIKEAKPEQRNLQTAIEEFEKKTKTGEAIPKESILQKALEPSPKPKTVISLPESTVQPLFPETKQEPKTWQPDKKAVETFTKKHGPAPKIPVPQSIFRTSPFTTKPYIPPQQPNLTGQTQYTPPQTIATPVPIIPTPIPSYEIPSPISTPTDSPLPATQPQTSPSDTSPASRSTQQGTPPTSSPSRPRSPSSSYIPPNPRRSALNRARQLSNNLRNFRNAVKAARAASAAVSFFTSPIGIIILILGILFFGLIFLYITNIEPDNRATALLPTTPGCFNQGGGGGCPDSATINANKQSPETCKFLNPSIDIFGDITDTQINQYVEIYWQQGKITKTKEEFKSKVDYIVQQARAVKLNPVLFLGLWKSESGFGNGLGCDPKTAGTFEQEVDCAVAINPGKGAAVSACASSHDAKSEGCKRLRRVRESNDVGASGVPNKQLYANYPLTYPISTFDDWEEGYGPHSPILDGVGTRNNNCTHSYNMHIEVAIELGACNAGTSPGTGGTNFAYCKFYRNDQTKELYSYSDPELKADFKGCPVGFRCDPGLDFLSPKLIGYIQTVANNTGVPATLLAAIARIESTVPEHPASSDIWVQKGYSISDYTDTDFGYIEQNLETLDNDVNKAKDTYIQNTSKAVCPTSAIGPALGIMQVEPDGGSYLEKGIGFINTYRSDKYPNGITRTSMQMYEKTATNTLAVKDFCDPLNSLYLAAGLIITKMGDAWNPAKIADKDYVSQVVKIYFGINTGEVGQMYVDSVYNSTSSCQGTSMLAQTASACYCTGAQTAVVASCPVQGGTVSTPSFQADPINGHCGANYDFECNYGENGRRAKAIDIPTTGGKDVILPTVSGQSVNWKVVLQSIDYDDDYGGRGITFEAQLGTDKWYIDFIHMQPVDKLKFTMDGSYPSGTAVGKTIIKKDGSSHHVHTTMGKNIKPPVVSGSESDGDPGWLPSDFMCGGPNLTAGAATGPTGTPVTPATDAKLEQLPAIGSTSTGVPINAWKLGNGPAAVAIVGGMKTGEEGGVKVVEDARDEFSAGTTYKVPAGLTVYFVPRITPAGDGGFNDRGKDVNRNFDVSDTAVPGGAWYKWGCSHSRYNKAGGIATTCSQSNLDGRPTSEHFPFYCSAPRFSSDPNDCNGEDCRYFPFSCIEGKPGSGPFSENESKAIRDLVNSNNITTVLSYRAPFKNVTASNAEKKIPATEELAKLMAQWLGSGYNYEPIFPTYPVTGQFMDWLQTVNKVGIEIEVRDYDKKIQLDAIQNALNWVAGGGATGAGGSSCLSQGIGSFVYYCQGDPQWASEEYSCGTMATYGCGPTSMSMVVSTFGVPTTPSQMADIFTQKGFVGGCDGTAMESVLQDDHFLSTYGLSAKDNIVPITGSDAGKIPLALAKKYIDSGQLIIASSGNFPSCNCSHIVVIDNVDMLAGTVNVRDPICSKQDVRVYPADAHLFDDPTDPKDTIWTWKYAYPVGK